MRKPVIRYFVAILIALILGPLSTFAADEASVTDLPETLYILPFLNVMVPAGVSSQLFDSFIDEMMIAGEQHGMTIRILKQDIDDVDKAWLAQQHFITGEVFAYDEESGCCSTELAAKARIYRYRPGNVDPDSEIIVPAEAFFDHDISTLEKERERLGGRIAKKLADKLIEELLPRP